MHVEKRDNFLAEFKCEEDKDRKLLEYMQREIKQNGNSKESISKLTKNLNKEQILKLEQLYISDIERLQNQINTTKRKILNLKADF